MGFPTSIRELGEGLQAGAFTSVDLTQHYLNVIAKKNPVINAFVDVYEAEARRLAEEVDAKRQAGSHWVLWPVSLLVLKKTCIIKERPPHAVPSYWRVCGADATAVKQCIDAGLIPMGKLNMDEFAMGSSCEYWYMGLPKTHGTLRKFLG